MPKKEITPVEIVPAFDSPKLKRIGVEIVAAANVVDEKTRKFKNQLIYDIVALGVALMRAKAEVGHGHFEDYLKSDTVSVLGITDRTARRYMAAAENAGLSENSTVRDVLALRKAKALHGKNPTDLYRLKSGDEETKPTAGETADLVRDTLDRLETECDAAITLRERMNDRLYERCWRKLQLTLETLTDTGWQEVEK